MRRASLTKRVREGRTFTQKFALLGFGVMIVGLFLLFIVSPFARSESQSYVAMTWGVVALIIGIIVALAATMVGSDRSTIADR